MMEVIDDDLDSYGIPAVKMSDVAEARQYGVKTFPSIIVFVKKIPELYEGRWHCKLQMQAFETFCSSLKNTVNSQ